MQSPMRGRLIHHYRVESLLGEGGMGTVYQAIDTHLERPVAVKMLHTHLVSQTSFMERFRNEALILARLNHPNIAVVYNFLQDGSDYFMAMEFVEGDSLEALIRKAGALPAPVAAEIVRQGLEGLSHAHRKGILHRDIKPANLMLTPEGTVKLMDFGIARVIGNQRLTQVNRIVGTLEYMAPELVQGEAPSAASDIYAMGILLYELLSGKLPFASRTDYALMQAIVQEKPTALRKLNPQVPKELEAIVHKALDKNPTKRFADAKEFQKALQPYYSQLAILDPSKLAASTPAPTTDVWNIQPVRQTVLAATKVTPAATESGRIQPVMRWASDNWQTLLAGGLTLVAFLFIGLIVFDQTDKPQTTADQTQTIVPKEDIKLKPKQPETTTDQHLTEVTLAQETPTTVSVPPPTQPKTVTPAPVETKEKAPQPKTVAPRHYIAGPVEVKKSVAGSPVAPSETPANTATPVTKSESAPETVAPKTTARKSIAIRRLRVNLALVEGLSSDASQEGQSIRFRVTEPVISDGEVVIQSGATAYGEVSRIKRADGEMFRKRSLLEFRINSVDAINGKRIALRSATISDEAKGQAVVFRPGQTFEVRTGDDVLNF
ncbi:serine/threonine-protein kinase [Spirosoma sp.]|uniref:serine/threonine protein kinase n=2 Tax=unclassified Spirosoma TaxID=2621999 RepID=UPI001ACB9F31|nr:serine/threonine-protein kinase [Spirosoma sp.]MBN8822557.1 protein kinase [Spirosoma sp.]